MIAMQMTDKNMPNFMPTDSMFFEQYLRRLATIYHYIRLLDIDDLTGRVSVVGR
jgi:hypothetical protein